MIIEKKNTADLLPADYNPRKDLKPGDAEYEKLNAPLSSSAMWNPSSGIRPPAVWLAVISV